MKLPFAYAVSLGTSHTLMNAIFVFLIVFSATALAAEEPPRDLFAALLKRPWPMATSTTLPTFPTRLQEAAAFEIAKSEAVRGAIRDLNPTNRNVVWFAAVDHLEQQRSVWCLQACLCHPHEDVQIRALRALGRLKDARAVSFLLIYAEYEAVFESGSENATMHGIIHREIAAALSAITGIEVTIGGQDPNGIRAGIRKWRKWEIDHPPTDG